MAARLVKNSAANTCRLLIDAPSEGAWNMALDEALLEEAADEDAATFRLYRWSRPTLSLGYFQSHRDRDAHPASQTCDLVRRASGGGAILHDDELTYSLALPAGHPLAIQHRSLYSLVHQSLIESLPRLSGHRVEIFAEFTRPVDKPFLCFQRRGAGDILVDGVKFAGSAQRRVRGAVLQHGSLLLGRSNFAPELPGWRETTGVSLVVAQLSEDWLDRLAARLGMEWVFGPPSKELTARATALSITKYGAREWTERR